MISPGVTRPLLAPLRSCLSALRRAKRLSKRLQYAKLRQQACVEDIDYRTPRGLDRSLLTMLVEGRWIDDHANLLICGPPASAKAGSPQRSATRPAATIVPCSTSASRGCSPISLWRAV